MTVYQAHESVRFEEIEQNILTHFEYKDTHQRTKAFKSTEPRGSHEKWKRGCLNEWGDSSVRGIGVKSSLFWTEVDCTVDRLSQGRPASFGRTATGNDSIGRRPGC
jgi:hypothetical protein